MGNDEAAPFLTAQWRDLVMMTWAVDPALLTPRLPAKTELDYFEGRCHVSLVAFRFLDTRVKGFHVPGHIDFDEINLRFYVRRKVDSGYRRGVVFFREIVPRTAIAFIARALYGEPYIAMATASVIQARPEGKSVSYSWGKEGTENFVSLECGPDSALPTEDSREAFIADHYWGYTTRRANFTSEYRVVHARWAVRPAKSFSCSVNFEEMYGADLASALSKEPESVFLADGSPIEVYPGERLKQDH